MINLNVVRAKDSGSLGKAFRASVVAAAAGCAAVSAQAAVVFDSITGGQRVYNQCFVCTGGSPTIAELGDVITFAGTDRQLTTVSVGFAQQNFSGASSYLADLTLKIYTQNGATQLASATTGVSISSTGLYTINFSFAGGIFLPNTIYYGLSVSSTSPNANDLRLSLWDYYTPANGGDSITQTLPVGTDPGTVVFSPSNVTSIVYGRLASSPSVLTASTGGGLGPNGLSDGFTPNVIFNAVPIPEPETYALMLAGLVAVGAYARRQSKKA